MAPLAVLEIRDADEAATQPGQPEAVLVHAGSAEPGPEALFALADVRLITRYVLGCLPVQVGELLDHLLARAGIRESEQFEALLTHPLHRLLRQLQQARALLGEVELPPPEDPLAHIAPPAQLQNQKII